MNVRHVFLVLALSFFTSVAHAGIFDNFFGHKEESDIVVETQSLDSHQEEVLVEEETVSADEYLDSSDEPENEQIFTQPIDTPDNIYEDVSPQYTEEKAISDDTLNDYSYDDENTIADPFIKQKHILLSYLQKPHKIYIKQHFPVVLKAIIPHSQIKAIQTDFIGGKDFKILNHDSAWEKTGDNSYENKFYIKLLTNNAKIPNFKISYQTQTGTVQSEILKAFSSKKVSLRQDDLFSSVIAKNLTLISHKERKYDENKNIVVIEINATDGNLEDFNTPFSSRQGIDELITNGLVQKIYYFAIVDNNKKIFKFKYFNTQKSEYEIISFDIKPIDTSISTHTDLNPQKSKYLLYKAIFLITLAVIFFILFLKYKKIYYVIFALIPLIFLIYTQAPITKAKLPAGVSLHILPINSSTVFFRTDKAMSVDILLKKEKYTKVLLPNKKIGWIKNENIQ